MVRRVRMVEATLAQIRESMAGLISYTVVSFWCPNVVSRVTYRSPSIP